MAIHQISDNNNLREQWNLPEIELWVLLVRHIGYSFSSYPQSRPWIVASLPVTQLNERGGKLSIKLLRNIFIYSWDNTSSNNNCKHLAPWMAHYQSEIEFPEWNAAREETHCIYQNNILKSSYFFQTITITYIFNGN